MSHSSGKEAAIPARESRETASAIDWSDLTLILDESAQERFGQWLDQELDQLERRLPQFTSAASRTSNRK